MTRSAGDIVADALSSAARRGAPYADVRVVEERRLDVATRNGQTARLDDAWTRGVGVRVLADGAWGFAAAADLSPSGVDALVARALDTARASALIATTPLTLAPDDVASGAWSNPVQVDPWSISVAERLDLLREADATLRRESLVRVATASVTTLQTHVTFASTEGHHQDQTFVVCGGGLRAVAANDDDMQVRSAPNSFGGDHAQGGWEFVTGLDLVGVAPRVASEAAALLSAAPCPPGRRTIILDGSQLALQIHESAGHPAELDRLLGWEASYAGGSFLTRDRLGAYRYGSDAVSIVADSTTPGALGTFAWDDEGTPSQRWDLVRDGQFVGYLTSRDTASAIGESRSRGAARAASWARIPLVRMVNVSLEPGTAGSVDDLVADTEDGIYMETNASWSIDDRRYHFQFGCELGWEIQNGERTRMIKNPTYAGISPEFWASCDAVCGRDAWRMWGLMNCGKGQPGQLMRMSHGAAPARFRDVEVGVGFADGGA